MEIMTGQREDGLGDYKAYQGHERTVIRGERDGGGWGEGWVRLVQRQGT